MSNNPDPRPSIEFSEDPAPKSPHSSLALLLNRELERGTVALRWHMLDYAHQYWERYLSGRSTPYVLCCRLRTTAISISPHTGRRGCQVGTAVMAHEYVQAGPAGTERLNRGQ